MSIHVEIGPCKCGPKEWFWSAQGVRLRNDHEEPGTLLKFTNICPGSDSGYFLFLCFKLQFYINLPGAQLTQTNAHFLGEF